MDDVTPAGAGSQTALVEGPDRACVRTVYAGGIDAHTQS